MKIDATKLAIAMLNAGVDSAKKLAELSGVSVNTISRISNGSKAKVYTVRRLTAVLGVNPIDILAESGQ